MAAVEAHTQLRPVLILEQARRHFRSARFKIQPGSRIVAARFKSRLTTGGAQLPPTLVMVLAEQRLPALQVPERKAVVMAAIRLLLMLVQAAEDRVGQMEQEATEHPVQQSMAEQQTEQP